MGILGSIRRQFSTSGPSRHRYQERSSRTSEATIPRHIMMSKKDGRIPYNGEDSLSSDRGDLEFQKKSRHASRKKPNDDGIVNGHSKDAQNKKASANVPQELFLGEYTDAANHTVESMLATQKSLVEFAGQLRRHLEEITEITDKGHTFDDLREQNRDKDTKISEQSITIRTLGDELREQEKELAKKQQRVDEERQDLDKQKVQIAKSKEDAEKRHKTMEAEAKFKVQERSDKLEKKLEKDLKDCRKNLEADFQKQKDTNEKRVVQLQSENSKLLARATEHQQQIETQKKKLEIAKEEIDDNARLKKSLKQEVINLEAQLKTMENEFELNTHPTDYYKQQFGRIAKEIKDLASQYFKALNTEEDAKIIHENLSKLDSGFASIPISHSEESQKLRIARARFTISSVFCKVIWQPFSADKILEYPTLVPLLREISTTLAESGEIYSKHSERVWSALTIRGLQNLPGTPASPRSSQLTPSHNCAELAVDKIVEILSPLVQSSNEKPFRKDLLALARSALNIWSSAQTDELQISVYPNLDPASRKEWRSSSLDPDTGTDVASSTLPRIFTLFPRITASEVSRIKKLPVNSLPGAWAGDDQQPEVTETCIHTGTGLPECSALFIAGKSEAEEARDQLVQEELEREERSLEKKKKELKARSERSGKHSRSGSMVSPELSSSSPTAM